MVHLLPKAQNPYWTDLSPAVFVVQGWVTRPEWSQNSDLRKKVFPPYIYRNTHIQTQAFERMPL